MSSTQKVEIIKLNCCYFECLNCLKNTTIVYKRSFCKQCWDNCERCNCKVTIKCKIKNEIKKITKTCERVKIREKCDLHG